MSVTRLFDISGVMYYKAPRRQCHHRSERSASLIPGVPQISVNISYASARNRLSSCCPNPHFAFGRAGSAASDLGTKIHTYLGFLCLGKTRYNQKPRERFVIPTPLACSTVHDDSAGVRICSETQSQPASEQTMNDFDIVDFESRQWH